MELSENKIMDIIERLARIEQKIEDGPASCPVHSEQIANLTKAVEAHDKKLAAVQTVIGKKELIVACFGAVGFGLAWALKALIGMAK